MKLKQQEYLRLLLFLSAYGTSFLTRMNSTEINEILSTYNISMEDLSKLTFILEDIMVLGTSYMEVITEEYKKVRMAYNEIIKNAGNLFKLLETDNNPVKSFALYVYLYRKGYLSCNHQFVYSFASKDFYMLSGADVVIGKAVCRSISSMFTDICRENGIEAYNMPVRVNANKFKDLVTLSSADLMTSNSNSNNKISQILMHLPVGNHVISHISDGKFKYDFDPTNDILLTEKRGKLYVSNSEDSYVYHDRISSFIPFMLGQIKTDPLTILGIRDKNLPSISHEEYVKTYREVLEMIKDNRDIFEKFYNDNKDKYYEIASIASSQHSLTKRYIPILPIK